MPDRVPDWTDNQQPDRRWDGGDASRIKALEDELRIARWDADVPIRELREEVERLRSAIEEYRLWRPGEKGHAAAHRRLMEALEAR